MAPLQYGLSPGAFATPGTSPARQRPDQTRQKETKGKDKTKDKTRQHKTKQKTGQDKIKAR
jgi:hypothetical protein